MLGIQVAVLLWRLGPGKRHFKQAAVQFSGITFVSEEFFLSKGPGAGSPRFHFCLWYLHQGIFCHFVLSAKITSNPIIRKFGLSRFSLPVVFGFLGVCWPCPFLQCCAESLTRSDSHHHCPESLEKSLDFACWLRWLSHEPPLITQVPGWTPLVCSPGFSAL